MLLDATELRRRYLQRIAGVRDDKVYIGPEIVEIVITSACNLRCQYCIAHHSPGDPLHSEKPRFLTLERFLGIIRDCVDLGVDNILLAGTGEPTLHPAFRDMMRYMEQKPLNVWLYTNGTFPLDHCSDVIKADLVRINIGAVDRQEYYKLHGKDHFDHVVNNIKRLVSLRDAVKPKFRIEIIFVINALNINQQLQMRRLGAYLGVNNVFFQKMKKSPYNSNIALKELSGPEETNENKQSPPACLNGWFYSVIELKEGNVKTCSGTPSLSPGNFNKRSFKQVWLSSKMMNRRLLEKYGHIKKMFKECQTCFYYDKNMQLMRILNQMVKINGFERIFPRKSCMVK